MQYLTPVFPTSGKVFPTYASTNIYIYLRIHISEILARELQEGRCSMVPTVSPTIKINKLN